MKKIICTECNCEINPNAGFYNCPSGIRCTKCNEQLKQTVTDKIFAKKVACRKELEMLLSEKLNDKHSAFPEDMYLVKDIEDIIYKYAPFYKKKK